MRRVICILISIVTMLMLCSLVYAEGSWVTSGDCGIELVVSSSDGSDVSSYCKDATFRLSNTENGYIQAVYNKSLDVYVAMGYTREADMSTAFICEDGSNSIAILGLPEGEYTVYNGDSSMKVELKKPVGSENGYRVQANWMIDPIMYSGLRNIGVIIALAICLAVALLGIIFGVVRGNRDGAKRVSKSSIAEVHCKKKD